LEKVDLNVSTFDSSFIDIKFQNNILHYAVESSNLELVHYLIEYIPKPIHPNQKGESVLFYGVDRGVDSEVIEYLLEKGLDPNEKNKKGQTMAFLAAKNGDIRVLEKLMDSGGQLFELNYKKQSPVFKAAACGNLETLIWLLDQNLKIEGIQDINGNTPFLIAAHCGKLNIVKYLLDRKGKTLLSEVNNQKKQCSFVGCYETFKKREKKTLIHPPLIKFLQLPPLYLLLPLPSPPLLFLCLPIPIYLFLPFLKNQKQKNRGKS